jgi:hypothetical protein
MSDIAGAPPARVSQVGLCGTKWRSSALQRSATFISTPLELSFRAKRGTCFCFALQPSARVYSRGTREDRSSVGATSRVPHLRAFRRWVCAPRSGVRLRSSRAPVFIATASLTVQSSVGATSFIADETKTHSPRRSNTQTPFSSPAADGHA